MPVEDADRIWSQAELRLHLIGIGFTYADFPADEVIPQGVKFIASPQPPITDKERERALKIIANKEHLK